MDVLRQPIAQELAQWPSFQAAKLSVQDIARALVRPPKRDMGDVALGCFVFAKAAGIKPNEMAAKLASSGEVGENNIKGASPGAAELVASATAAGPYVNLKLNRAAAIEQVLSAIEGTCPGNDAQTWSFGGSDEGKGKTLVLDFSSPNIAKPLAVHHLRSTMIGNSIKKIRESQGWRVVGINHLGDWGTGFGKLIAGLKREAPDVEKRAIEMWQQARAEGRERIDESIDGRDSPLGTMTVKDLNAAYKRFSEDMADNAELEQRGRDEFRVLEEHVSRFQTQKATTEAGEVNYRIWRQARRLSLAEFKKVYDRLGLRFEDWHADDSKNKENETRPHFFVDSGIYVGESFYVGDNDLCLEMRDGAIKMGVAVESEGAIVIFTDNAKDAEGKPKVPPVILLKSDGATSYHARDMASALFRSKRFLSNDLGYVVGGEQTLHFKQLFKALEMLGYEWAKNCKHVDFGLLLFKQPDGKWAKASTRKGRVIMLEDLLDEAIAAVKEIMSEKNPELSGSAASEEIAQKVGVGAVVFNDLKNGRRNDIKFDWDEILNFQGETGPYMLMQYVRMGSVSEKFAQVYPHLTWAGGDVSKLARDDEFELALLLAGFPEAMRRASAEYEPSNVAKALIEIAAQTSSWWTNTKDTRIVGDDAELSRARVRLVNAIRKVLGRGLLLLGISLVERM